MLKRLFSSLREYKKDTILTPVYVIVEVIMEVSIPFVMAFLLDYGIEKGNMRIVLITGLILVAAASVSLWGGVMAGYKAANASAGFAKNLRKDMFQNVQRFSFSNIDKFSSSSLITRLTTDVTNLQNAFQMIIRMAIRSPIMLIFALAAAMSIDRQLSLIYLAAIPVLGIALYFIMTTVHPIFVRVFRTYDKLNSIVQENLAGVRVVKSFLREDHETEKFRVRSRKIYDDFSKAEKRLALNMPLVQFLVYTTMILLSWFGSHRIIASGNNPALGLSTGQLMSLITYSMQILMSLMMVSMVIVMITISRASAERIVEVLDEESDLQNGDNPVLTVPDGTVEFKDVSFSYYKDAEKPVLSHINLKITSGQTVGILGGTGSSKSSLVQLIPRLYDVTGGSVEIGGIDVRNYDLKTLRDAVSVVLQKNDLFSGTIKSNLLWGDENASDEEIERHSRQAQAHGFISEYPEGYDTPIERGGTNVSGGQKQRITIARALLKKPKVLILDDSTSAVDTKTDRRIRDSFRQDLPDTTKIIIAQRIDSVKDSDLIIVLNDGMITASGTHDELMENSPIYREVYESQRKGE